ncbi:hypothetical protein McanCB56680_000123 [Microsporum canis]
MTTFTASCNAQTSYTYKSKMSSPPSKRRRIDGQFSPNERLSQDFDVNEARKANDLRLKSRFESIFEKYGKDFSSVGDEIDLAKGTIVVDNGHLTEMGDERDVGRGLWDDFHPEDDSEGDEDAPSQNAAPLPETMGDSETGSAFFQEWVMQDDYNVMPEKEDQPAKGDTANPRSAANLETGMTATSTTSPPKTIKSGTLQGHETTEDHENLQLPNDCLWDAPPLPATALSAGLEDMATATTRFIERTPSPDNTGSIWAAPRSRRRRIPHINKPKSPPKKTPMRKSKTASNDSDSDSDDPIQNRTPIFSTPRRPVNVLPIPPPDDSILRTLIIPANVYIPPPEEPISTIEDNGNNDATSDEQETVSKVNMDTPSITRKINPVTPSNPQCTPYPSHVVTTAREDEVLGVDMVTESPSTELMTPRDPAENLTPQEVKTLVTLRLAKRKPWRDVSLAIPSRSSVQLRQWYYAYCKHIDGSLSTPIHWTDAEREILALLASDIRNSWDTVQSQFLDKSLEDIQREWVKICVGENIWQGWVNSKTPNKAKKREPPFPRTPVRSSVTVPSPLRLTTGYPTASKHSVVEKSPSAAANPPKNREESPDPLSEAFEKAWHSTGLSSVQISTPPRASRSPKKHLLPSGKAQSIVGT